MDYNQDMEVNPKLIRDKVPERATEEGDVLKTRVLQEDEFKGEVRRKLAEEAREAAAALTREELLGELADVLELIITVGGTEGITVAEIEESRLKKLARTGGFEKRLLLIGKE